MEACSLSKEISTCDNHSGEIQRCLVEEEVSKVQLFKQIVPQECREESCDFCDIVYSYISGSYWEAFFNN